MLKGFSVRNKEIAYSKGTRSSVVASKDEAFDPARAVMSVASG
jgi:hypothetical protein